MDMRITDQLPLVQPRQTEPKMPSSQSFGAVLDDALRGVNESLHRADEAAEKLLTGDIEFHDAMLITEKANLALQLTMAVRSKVMEAYQEIMRMQV